MPWVEREEDAEFMAFIENFRENSRPKILSLLEKYREKTVYRFSSREESDDFLKGEIL